jgi:hypothetical protein
MAATKAAHPAEVAALIAYSQQSRYSSEFMGSLLNQYLTRGTLSENQIAALARGIEKQKARDAERAQAPVEMFPRIEALVRVENLKLHLGGFKVSLSRTGTVWVSSEEFGGGTYGIIEQGGGLKRFKGMTDAMHATLLDVEKRGIVAVKEIGIATGRCCVCNRTLTDDYSIQHGIGPVCSDRVSSFTCEALT